MCVFAYIFVLVCPCVCLCDPLCETLQIRAETTIEIITS